MLSKKEYLKRLNSKDRNALNLIILPAFKKQGFRLKAIGSSLHSRDYRDIDMVVFGDYSNMTRAFLACGRQGASVSVDVSCEEKYRPLFCSRYFITLGKIRFHLLIPIDKDYSAKESVDLSS